MFTEWEIRAVELSLRMTLSLAPLSLRKPGEELIARVIACLNAANEPARQ